MISEHSLVKVDTFFNISGTNQNQPNFIIVLLIQRDIIVSLVQGKILKLICRNEKVLFQILDNNLFKLRE
jgi:hypothetical protein